MGALSSGTAISCGLRCRLMLRRGLAGIWGMGGFSAQFVGQTTRDAPRRVRNSQTEAIIFCEGDS